MTSAPALRELLLDRRNLGAVGLLIFSALAAWALLAWAAWDMDGLAGRVFMPMGEISRAGYLAAAFAMWTVMMAGMMLPSAVPMVLLFASMERSRNAGTNAARVAAFAAGYFGVWVFFSFAAAAAQTTLLDAALFSPTMASVGKPLGGAILIAAGLYQWTPLKRTCLAHCRSPLGFLLTAWREGRRGALAMGARHGLSCIGCCWLLMAILFAVGVMNLLWVALLAVAVTIEKLISRGEWLTRGLGAVFVAFGFVLLS